MRRTQSKENSWNAWRQRGDPRRILSGAQYQSRSTEAFRDALSPRCARRAIFFPVVAHGATRLTMALLACALVAPAAASAQVADPNHVAFTLEGCRPNADVSFAANGPFVCPDADYTTGNLGKFWNEGDFVPVPVTADNNDGAQTYNVVIAADYRLDDALGYDYITVPVLNTALSDAGCTEARGERSQLRVAGSRRRRRHRPDDLPHPDDHPARRRDVRLRLRAAAGDRLRGPDRRARPRSRIPAPLGASFYSGSSLHGYLLNQDLESAGIGQRRVPIPVNDIVPQALQQDRRRRPRHRLRLGHHEELRPRRLPRHLHRRDDLRARPRSASSGPRRRSPSGQVAVTTTFIFDNPAHRPLDVSSTTRCYTCATMTTQIDAFTQSY